MTVLYLLTKISSKPKTKWGWKLAHLEPTKFPVYWTNKNLDLHQINCVPLSWIINEMPKFVYFMKSHVLSVVNSPNVENDWFSTCNYQCAIQKHYIECLEFTLDCAIFVEKRPKIEPFLRYFYLINYSWHQFLRWYRIELYFRSYKVEINLLKVEIENFCFFSGRPP